MFGTIDLLQVTHLSRIQAIIVTPRHSTDNTELQLLNHNETMWLLVVTGLSNFSHDITAYVLKSLIKTGGKSVGEVAWVFSRNTFYLEQGGTKALGTVLY